MGSKSSKISKSDVIETGQSVLAKIDRLQKKIDGLQKSIDETTIRIDRLVADTNEAIRATNLLLSEAHKHRDAATRRLQDLCRVLSSEC